MILTITYFGLKFIFHNIKVDTYLLCDFSCEQNILLGLSTGGEIDGKYFFTR